MKVELDVGTAVPDMDGCVCCVFIYYHYVTTVYTDVCVRVLCVWPSID